MESSNLKLRYERRGDADLLIAAGLSGGLAMTLYRLQTEYDSVRGEHQAALMRQRELESCASAEQASVDVGPTRAERIREDAQREALTAHVLILSRLGTLRDAKQMFGDFAVIEATKRMVMKNDRQVLILAGRVLEVFLSPNCRHCAGRGFNGATHRGEMPILCRPCRGSGHRRDLIGEDDTERAFAGHLFLLVDSLMFIAQRDIRTGLHLVEDAKRVIAEAED